MEKGWCGLVKGDREGCGAEGCCLVMKRGRVEVGGGKKVEGKREEKGEEKGKGEEEVEGKGEGAEEVEGEVEEKGEEKGWWELRRGREG